MYHQEEEYLFICLVIIFVYLSIDNYFEMVNQSIAELPVFSFLGLGAVQGNQS